MGKDKKGIIESIMKSYKIVFLIIILLVAYGIYGLVDMDKQEFPEFTIRQGVIGAVYPGATPEEIEEQLTKPLENFLFTFQEVDKKKTYSYTQDGIVYVFVELNKNIHNKNEAWSKIRHGLKDFKMMLPAGVLALVVNDDFGNTSSLLITMQSSDKTYRELQHYMDLLCDKLRTIDAMGNINVIGKQKEEINVYIDKEKLATYGISDKTLMANLYTQGLLTIGGTLATDDMTVPLHVVSPYRSEKEIIEQIVYSDPQGNVVRLKDIARIVRENADPDNYIMKDGQKTLVLSIEMRSGNNIVEFGEEVEAALQDFQRTLPESVSLYRITDLPEVVGNSVYSFLIDLVTSIVIVILVLLILFPLRSALVAAIGIPISTAITLAVMYTFGIEMNTVTLAVLIVVLGMIVDNSVVVIDGYIDLLNRGYSRWDAAVTSANMYFSPLLLATIAISSIFFPFLFTLTGPLGDFIKFFPWSIAVALFISLGISMFLTPYLEYRYIGLQPPNQKVSFVTKIQNRFFCWLQVGYEWVLGRCFKHPYITLGIGFGTVLSAVLIFLNLPMQMMPKAERNCFAVEIYLPSGSPLKQTRAVCDSVEALLKQDKRIESATVFVGTGSPRFMTTYAPNMPTKNYAQFIVNTVSEKATKEVLKAYKDKYDNWFPEAYVRFKQMDYQAVKNPVEVRFMGNDLQELEIYSDSLTRFMHTLDDELSWIHSDHDEYMPTVKIELNQDEATRLGITKAMVSAGLATAFGGTPLTTVWEGDYAVAVKLRLENADSSFSFEDIGNTLISGVVPGVWVPLRQIATLTPDWQPAQIGHRNGVNCITVSADLKYNGSQPKTMKKIQKYIESNLKNQVPEDIKIVYGGLTEVNEETAPEIISGLIAALLIVFFFLVFTFKKISLSLLSMGAMTLCLFGAFLGLWIFGVDVSLTAILGIVSLIGIIVRNAIIMFEYAEELHKGGASAHDAAFEAGKRRMRPIFLTSATTAVGVIPMIISMNTLWMPMAVVIFFGTLFSIFMVITVLPVAYWKVYAHTKVKAAKSE